MRLAQRHLSKSVASRVATSMQDCTAFVVRNGRNPMARLGLSAQMAKKVALNGDAAYLGSPQASITDAIRR